MKKISKFLQNKLATVLSSSLVLTIIMYADTVVGTQNCGIWIFYEPTISPEVLKELNM